MNWDEYWQYLQQRGFSPHTIANYRYDIQAFERYLTKHDLDWQRLDSQWLRRYSAWIHRQGLGPRSIQRRLAAVRKAMEFWHQQGAMGQNLAIGIRAPRFQPPLPKPVDVDQLQQLLDQQPNNALQARDLAMMELAYSAGLRVAELVQVKRQDVDWSQRLISVWGKGSKQRIVPVGQKALTAIQRWLAYGQVNAQQDYLFVSNRGRPLTTRQVQKRFKDYGRQYGVDLHPHRLRHSCASHFLESSGDLRAVQEMLGHEQLATTQVYTRLDFQQLAQVYDKAHPRARSQNHQEEES